MLGIWMVFMAQGCFDEGLKDPYFGQHYHAEVYRKFISCLS